MNIDSLLTPQKDQKFCQCCGRTFIPNIKVRVLCTNCSSGKKEQVKKYYENLKENKNNNDKCTCQICGFKSTTLCVHIHKMHKISMEQYYEWFPGKQVISDEYLKGCSERIKGDKNPAYQHGGKFSPFSDKFVHADKIDKEELFKKAAKSRLDNCNDNTKIEFYLKRGFNEEEAKQKLSERQTTFSKEICIEKYGEEEGVKIWKDRQERWIKNNKKSNFGKISQKLFWELYYIIKHNFTIDDIYFAQFDNGVKDESGKNHEYRLMLNDSVILPDFFIESKKLIIEMDGVYYHRNNPENKTREMFRDNMIKQSGYKVIHVTDEDYKKMPQQILKQCLDFINE